MCVVCVCVCVCVWVCGPSAECCLEGELERRVLVSWEGPYGDCCLGVDVDRTLAEGVGEIGAEEDIWA